MHGHVHTHGQGLGQSFGQGLGQVHGKGYAQFPLSRKGTINDNSPKSGKYVPGVSGRGIGSNFRKQSASWNNNFGGLNVNAISEKDFENKTSSFANNAEGEDGFTEGLRMWRFKRGKGESVNTNSKELDLLSLAGSRQGSKRGSFLSRNRINPHVREFMRKDLAREFCKIVNRNKIWDGLFISREMFHKRLKRCGNIGFLKGAVTKYLFNKFEQFSYSCYECFVLEGLFSPQRNVGSEGIQLIRI